MSDTTRSHHFTVWLLLWFAGMFTYLRPGIKKARNSGKDKLLHYSFDSVQLRHTSVSIEGCLTSEL